MVGSSEDGAGRRAMTDLQVRAQRLSGIGWRYTIPADRGRQVVVVVEDHGPRYLALLDPRLDEALTTVRLPAERASVLAALLTGARFTVTPSDEFAGAGAADPPEVVIETLPVAGGSPAMGRTQNEAALRLGGEDTTLGVIDDRTPELTERSRTS